MSANGPQTLGGYQFGGSGSYTASSSSASGYQGWQAWAAFDNNPVSFWENQIVNTGVANKQWSGVGVNGVSNTYNTSTTVGPFSTTISGTPYSGEWIQIQFPVGIVLYSYGMYGRSGFSAPNSRMPYTWYIGGSNDGSTWTLVDSQTGYTSWVNSPQTLSTFTTTNTTAYTYYRLVITAINSGGSGTQELNIGQWSIYGSNASFNTDFYADRLGNLLTVPVTGQALIDWLGGATGYVATWYDQTGKGNDATQVTAANQPIIQRATKGPGYSVLFNGTTNYLTGMSYTFLNGTNYSFSLVERRNSAAAFMMAISSGNAGTDQGLHYGYYTGGTSVRFGQFGGDDMDLSPYPAYAGASEPVHYWCGVESSTAGRFIYENATVAKSDATRTTLLSSTSGNFVIGTRLFGTPYYYSGEIFEVDVYTTALGTSDITTTYNNQLSYTGT
jgi:hypothetical protein